MRVQSASRRGVLAGLAGVLLAVVLAACSAPSSSGQPTAAARFAGYKWGVVSISHGGKATPVPARYGVYLQFASDGHFGANEPVNYHSGSYRVAPGGFTTSDVGQTAVGYAGHDPVVLLSVAAIAALGIGGRAQAIVSGSMLTVTVGGYTLIARRDGRQAAF